MIGYRRDLTKVDKGIRSQKQKAVHEGEIELLHGSLIKYVLELCHQKVCFLSSVAHFIIQKFISLLFSRTKAKGVDQHTACYLKLRSLFLLLKKNLDPLTSSEVSIVMRY